MSVASLRKEKSNPEQELICPICLHVFVEPVQLPCKHNFCRGCIGESHVQTHLQ
uniref:RING-type domain-containing protein n=1 Tax=Anas platyrhynchos platyrhynchos TaxID=8840 RepID=A0A493SSU0_ANAPP